MKKFVALYVNTSGVHQAPPEQTEEQKAAMMAPWFQWKAKYGDRIADFGSPLLPASQSENGDMWSSSKKLITGYSIVQANSLTDAQEMFKGHPIFTYPNHAIEISECAEM